MWTCGHTPKRINVTPCDRARRVTASLQDHCHIMLPFISRAPSIRTHLWTLAPIFNNCRSPGLLNHTWLMRKLKTVCPSVLLRLGRNIINGGEIIRIASTTHRPVVSRTERLVGYNNYTTWPLFIEEGKGKGIKWKNISHYFFFFYFVSLERRKLFC